MATTTCPVLRPSLREFEDFEAYVASVDELLVEHGVVKVVPPDGWYTPKTNWREWGLRLKAPIRQLASGKAGVYHVDIVEARSMSLEEFEARASRQPCDEDSYEKIERKFWKSLGIASVGEPPMYGADMVGSVFDNDCASSWNLSNLPTILKLLGNDLPGVTNPMLYVGMWRAMFAFHVEDMDLYSINYVHCGAPKSWYSIPEEYAERFETLANSYFPDLYNECKEYLRHKVVMISPSKLKEHGIPYRTVVQEAGEFVITSPRAYHAGYNHGFNVAEATNFATERWISYGRMAGVCKCRPYCVSIDMDYFETKYRRMRRQQQQLQQQQPQMSIGASASAAEGEHEPESGDTGSTDHETEPQWQHEGWEFACSCGLRCTHEDHPSKHPVGEQFECAACGIWCHVACVYGEDSSLTSIPEFARCGICMTIDDMEQGAERNRGRRSAPRRNLSGADRTADASERRSRKRSRRQLPASAFQRGAEVYLRFIDGSWEPGTIAMIEDGSAKVHLQKPRRGRNREQWVSLQSGSLVLKEEWEEAHETVQESISESLFPCDSTRRHQRAEDRAARASRRRRLTEAAMQDAPKQEARQQVQADAISLAPSASASTYNEQQRTVAAAEIKQDAPTAPVSRPAGFLIPAVDLRLLEQQLTDPNALQSLTALLLHAQAPGGRLLLPRPPVDSTKRHASLPTIPQPPAGGPFGAGLKTFLNDG